MVRFHPGPPNSLIDFWDMTNKKLFRSKTNRVWAGVLGGLGEYFDVDPVVLRLVFLALVILTGFFPGVIFYILAIFIVPSK